MSDTWGTVYQMERDKALGNDAESLRLENARLRAALEPFTEYWEARCQRYRTERKSDWIDRMPGDWPAFEGGYKITIQSFRDAVTAIRG